MTVSAGKVVLVLYHSMVYGGRSLNALLGILMKAVTNSLASLGMARIKLLNIGLLRPVANTQKLFVIRTQLVVALKRRR